MSSSFNYDANKGILHIRHEQKVSLDSRVKLIKKIADLELSRNTCILSDIRGLTSLVTGTESKLFIEYMNRLGLAFRKIAIVHREDFPAYTLVASDALLNNIQLDEFTSIKAAEAWLQS